MIDKLKVFDIAKNEVDKLESYQSRDGFVLLTDDEFEEMQSYLKAYPIFKNLVALLTDENSNYWCLYIDGCMKGMICYLNHEEYSLEPKFLTISNLIQTIESKPEAYDFDDFTENDFGFPTTKDLTSFIERPAIIKQLFVALETEKDEDNAVQIAFSIMALASASEVEQYVYPFLDSEDMYIQERAIQLIGFHKYLPARDKLRVLTTTAMLNGQMAAEIALKKLRNQIKNA